MQFIYSQLFSDNYYFNTLDWRSLPDDEGFTLLKEKMHSFCGVHPHTIKKQDGAVIKSLDFVSPQETVFAEEAPPKYDVASQNTHGLISDD